MKRFIERIGLKQNLDSKTSKPPYVSEGEIWWASLGENIGSEIYGKNYQFARPVIIFKKFSKELYFVIPVTSSVKPGSWYIKFQFKGRVQTACLHQSRAIDYRRLINRMGTLKIPSTVALLKDFVIYTIKINPRHFWWGRGKSRM